METLKNFLNKLNRTGFPVPMLKDPKTGMASVSLSMLFLSFNVVLFGLIGKFSHVLDIDLTNALTFFAINASLYFGRKLTSDKNVIEGSSDK